MDTILLDPSTNDLLVDASGNIALASAPYALAQDIASAIKLFKGELYYDNTKGVPYFQNILGEGQSPLFLAAQIEAAALTAPGVVEARCTSLAYAPDRSVTGTLKTTDATGQSHNVTF